LQGSTLTLTIGLDWTVNSSYTSTFAGSQIDGLSQYVFRGQLVAAATLGCAVDCGPNGRCAQADDGGLACSCACGWAGANCSVPSGFCSTFPAELQGSAACPAPPPPAAPAPAASCQTAQSERLPGARTWAHASAAGLLRWRGPAAALHRRHARPPSSVWRLRPAGTCNPCLCWPLVSGVLPSLCPLPLVGCTAGCSATQQYSSATGLCECLDGWGGPACDACETSAACDALFGSSGAQCSDEVAFQQGMQFKAYTCDLEVGWLPNKCRICGSVQKKGVGWALLGEAAGRRAAGAAHAAGTWPRSPLAAAGLAAPCHGLCSSRPCDKVGPLALCLSSPEELCCSSPLGRAVPPLQGTGLEQTIVPGSFYMVCNTSALPDGKEPISTGMCVCECVCVCLGEGGMWLLAGRGRAGMIR
jgi:hypothetical protein